VPSWKGLASLGDVRLARLFGPEHGVDGGAIYMEAIGDAVHPPTGLPVVSLYGNSSETLKPRREHLADLDALLFDVADVGARYYTYIWTMFLAMQACAEAGVRFVVCDRPNPIGGAVEGTPQEADYLSFVGLYPISVRHGMTSGEMARLLVAETGLDLDLHVSPVTRWARETSFEATGLPWVPPSPNMPTVATAFVFPGMCLLEGTNLSEGRGTTRPFEMFGAPWLSAPDLSEALNAVALPGVSFLPAHFRPQFEKHAGETCAGAMLFVTDRARFRPFETGLRVIETARRLAPRQFRWRTEPYEFDRRPAVDLLTGSRRFRELLDAGEDIGPEIARHGAGAKDFQRRREPFLLYADRRPAAVAFVGGHNAGKTTLLVDLVPRLKALGLTVGAIKHTSKDAEDDLPGKDSYRLAASGARVCAFATPERTTARRFGEEEELSEILAREFAECDLVLIEGYKTLPVPKIEVSRGGAPRPAVAGAGARISERAAEGDIPTYAFEDLEGIVKEVLRLAGLDRPFARV